MLQVERLCTKCWILAVVIRRRVWPGQRDKDGTGSPEFCSGNSLSQPNPALSLQDTLRRQALAIGVMVSSIPYVRVWADERGESKHAYKTMAKVLADL